MPEQDPTLTLLIQGITATAELLGCSDDTRARAEQSWTEFEQALRRRPEQSPLGQLSERFRLNTFELRCVLLASRGSSRVVGPCGHAGASGPTPKLYVRNTVLGNGLESTCMSSSPSKK